MLLAELAKDLVTNATCPFNTGTAKSKCLALNSLCVRSAMLHVGAERVPLVRPILNHCKQSRYVANP